MPAARHYNDLMVLHDASCRGRACEPGRRATDRCGVQMPTVDMFARDRRRSQWRAELLAALRRDIWMRDEMPAGRAESIGEVFLDLGVWR